MKRWKRNLTLEICLVIMAALIIVVGIRVGQNLHDEKNGIGKVIDTYKGVDVHYNGEDYGENHGKSYSRDRYCYGYKWQCVEYIKRFYYENKKYKMPDGYGNAKDFFDESLSQGELNKRRGLYQYKNGGNVKPQEDDIIVFNDTTYGHIAIVSEVTDDHIEIVQQNMGSNSRARYDLKYDNGNYYVGGNREPAGWLRLK